MGFEKKSWQEFREAGLLWWVNRALHLFGWSIAVEVEDGEVVDVYPGHVTYRGFSEEDEKDGFKKLTKHLAEEAAQLVEDVELDSQPGFVATVRTVIAVEGGSPGGAHAGIRFSRASIENMSGKLNGRVTVEEDTEGKLMAIYRGTEPFPGLSTVIDPGGPQAQEV